MANTTRYFQAAGYVFTYERATQRARVRLEMWREDGQTGNRYWVTVATCAPNRKSAYQVAMALVAWVRALDVRPRASVQALAVAESLAVLNDRLAQMGNRPTDQAVVTALQTLVTGGAAAA